MKQILDSMGKITIVDLPIPAVEAGKLLVKTSFSCISTGTELSGLRASATPLWRKAMQKPEHLKKVLRLAQEKGITSAVDAVRSKTAPKALGYSLSGVVADVGEGVVGFKIGDRVACAGAQWAFHAEYANVPINLVVTVPPNVGMEEAATVALGAIALQGVRRLEPTFGETFLVVGLGVLGQLTTQFLRASGCRVLGCDVNEDRVALALKNGLQGACSPGPSLPKDVFLATGGVGADGVIITASGADESIIHNTFLACRKKGRVVLVGDVPLHLKREDLYEKELDFRISTSYGPGRYDRSFEEEGVDYPLPQVRWTETRNMGAYLEAIASGLVKPKELLGETTSFLEAPSVFERLKEGKWMTAILRYDELQNFPVDKVLPLPIATTSWKREGKKIGLALLGAGSFAEAIHLPNLKALNSIFSLKAISSRTGYKAKALADRFGVERVAASWQEIEEMPDVEAVLISTRHNLHAGMALQALKAGKSVLVEKPLALGEAELEKISAFYRSGVGGKQPLLMTGYNRRFSPAAVRAKKNLSQRKSPVVIQYTMNAGFLPPEHWVHGAEGGGRNLGEACHIYDLFVFLVGNTKIRRTQVTSLGTNFSPFQTSDNFQACFEFVDGSLATLLYTSMGNSGLPKEEMSAFFDSKCFKLHDYKSSDLFNGPTEKISEVCNSKGHKEELEAFAEGMKTGIWPIALEEQLCSARMALTVEKLLVGEGK